MATDSVLRYDENGDFVDVFVASNAGGIDGPMGITLGPDGHLYVSSGNTGAVHRYNGANGAPLPGPNGSPGTAEFVASGSGGLDAPRALAFGPDGNLYVASLASGSVMRYDGATGAPLPGPNGAQDSAQFIPVGSGGLESPMGLRFGADGILYVSGKMDQILRFDAASGDFVDVLAPVSPTGLCRPTEMAFGSNGDLFVADTFNDRVSRISSGLTVTLSAPSPTPVTVSFSTAVDSAGAHPAIAGSDYVPASGALTFAPGETTHNIFVAAIDDTSLEPNETFFVSLSNASGATIVDGQGVATITDDDSSRQISIDDVMVCRLKTLTMLPQPPKVKGLCRLKTEDQASHKV